MKNTFYISCPIDTYSGYGARSRDFVKALIESGKYDVKILSQRWGATNWGFIEDHSDEWGFLNSHILPTQQLKEQPDIWMQISVPNEFQRVGKYNIGLTAGMETTLVAPQWVEGVNRMDLILVSSNHSKNSFLNTSYEAQLPNGQTKTIKVEKPIEVIFEGINLDLYKPLQSTELTNQDLKSTLNSIPEKFAYLFVGHWMQGNLGEDRKNVGLMIKAFYEIFKGKKNVPALILKASTGNNSYMGEEELMKRINTIRKTIPSNFLPNVYLLHGDFTDNEMNELYNHPKVKAMVSFTKGEGFGRPLLEFTTTNKPIIATNWSGHVDFLNSKYSYLMGGSLTNVHPSAAVKDMILEQSQWFSVNPSEAAKALTSVFENYKDYKNLAKRQNYQTREKFSYEAMKELIIETLDKYVPDMPKQVELKMPNLNLPKLKPV